MGTRIILMSSADPFVVTDEAAEVQAGLGRAEHGDGFFIATYKASGRPVAIRAAAVAALLARIVREPAAAPLFGAA
jgi:hypothetical protein